MQRKFPLRVLLSALIVAGACKDDGTSPSRSARVRFANLTGTNLSMANGGVVRPGFGNVGFGSATPCLSVNANTPALTFTTGPSVVGGFVPELTARGSYTVVAYPALNGTTAFFTVDNAHVSVSGQAGLRVVNLDSRSASLDVYVTAPGAPLAAPSATGVSFGTSSDMFSVSADSLQIRLTVAGGQNVVLNAGTFEFTEGETSALLIAPPATATTASRSALVTGC